MRLETNSSGARSCMGNNNSHVARLLFLEPPFQVGDEYVVVRPTLAKGGCGIVYKAKPIANHNLPSEVVLKCLKDVTSEPTDKQNELRERFLIESNFLAEHQDESLPRFFSQGQLPDGRPYYAMELLRPVNAKDQVFLANADDADRVACLLDILLSAETVHKSGYVHEDIKPANVMRRPGTGRYLLVDYGTVHQIEEEDLDRFHFGTSGYDAPEKGHTPARDIYAIGQVIRDMFPEQVPIKWNLVVNKCISRRPEYRYKNIDELRQDILKIDELGKAEMERRILEWRMDSVRQQKTFVESKSKKLTWRELRGELSVKCKDDDRFCVGVDELLIDLTKLERRSIEITDAIALDREKIVVIKGPGILRANLSPVSSSGRVVVLMDHVTLIDTSAELPEKRGIVYCVGEHCYVNLKNITKGVTLPPSTYRLSAAGDAFIRCGGSECVSDIISHTDGVLWSARPANAVSKDELFSLNAYKDRKGLASYIWDSTSHDGKVSGSYLDAMGVQYIGVIRQLEDAFGCAGLFEENTEAASLPLGALIGTICGSWYTQLSKDGVPATDAGQVELFHENSRLPVDGEMTIAIAAALCGCKHDWVKLPGFAAKAMRIFGRANPFSFGERFREWIFDDDKGAYGSWGNGAVMRVSPCAWAASNLEEAIRLADAVTNVTHNSEPALVGARAVVSAIFIAREMGVGKRAKSKDEILNKVAEYYPELKRGDFTVAEIRKNFKYDESCQNTVPQAVRVFYESSGFEDAIRLAISLGGDSDTIASVTGAIAEAYYGIPEDMRKKSLDAKFLDSETRIPILQCFASKVDDNMMQSNFCINRGCSDIKRKCKMLTTHSIAKA